MMRGMSAIHSVELALRWSDMDAYGHVNNVQYMRLLEEARVRGMDAWFGPDRSLLDSGIVVVHQEIDHLAQLNFRPEPVVVEMRVSEVSGGSFVIGYEIRDPESIGETCYARAETTIVGFDFAAGHARRWEEEVRRVLDDLRTDPVPLHRRRS